MGAELAVVSDAAALEADPVQYMAVVLNRAKEWLSEAASIAEVRETKAIAVGYESVIREKELAFDAQLSATEIVRRCERRIGELVREGQDRGEIRKRGDDCRTDLVLPEEQDQQPKSTSEIFGNKQEMSDTYAMSGAPVEQFEQAIATAREDGNLSRANVVRKVKGGTPSPAPRGSGGPFMFATEIRLQHEAPDQASAEAWRDRLIKQISTRGATCVRWNTRAI